MKELIMLSDSETPRLRGRNERRLSRGNEGMNNEENGIASTICNCGKNISLAMLQHKSFLILVLFVVSALISGPSYGQDTMSYWRGQSIQWVAECYTFYKLNKNMRVGRFEKTMDSDDGQKWFGTGRFTEDEKHFYLEQFSVVHLVYNRDSFPVSCIVVASDTCVTPRLVFYKIDSVSFSLLQRPEIMATYYLRKPERHPRK